MIELLRPLQTTNEDIVRKLAIFGLFLLVIFYHVLPVADMLFGKITFLGKNVFIVLPALFFGATFLYFSFRMSKRMQLAIASFVAIYFVTVSLGIIFNAEDFKSYLNKRYFLLFLFMMVVILNLLMDTKYRALVLKAYIITIVIQCTLGIAHNVFFPTYWYVPGFDFISRPDFSGATRESGTLISVSAFGYVLLCGIMVLVYIKDLPWRLSATPLKIGLMCYLFYGILLSGSRGPIMLSLLVGFSMLLSKKTLKNILPALAGFLLFAFLSTYIGAGAKIQYNLFDRYAADGFGGRYEKFILGFMIISQKFYYVLIGAPGHVQLSTTLNNFGVSDNSFILLMINFGVPATLFLIFVLLYAAWHFVYHTDYIIPVIVGLVCLSTTNSILWEPWIFYYLLAMVFIWFNARENRSRRQALYLPDNEKHDELCKGYGLVCMKSERQPAR